MSVFKISKPDGSDLEWLSQKVISCLEASGVSVGMQKEGGLHRWNLKGEEQNRVGGGWGWGGVVKGKSKKKGVLLY